MDANIMIEIARTTAQRLFDHPAEIVQMKDNQIENLESRIRELCKMMNQQQETILAMVSGATTVPTLPQADLAEPTGATIKCPRCKTAAYVDFMIGHPGVSATVFGGTPHDLRDPIDG